MKRFDRYVALGDSSTEGLEDPDGRGGYRGWANRLAEHIAAAQGSLLYANLGVRGKSTREIREEQLEPALAMKPDLATLFAGTNDAVARRFDAEGMARDLVAMQERLIASGATVLTFTLPDLEPVMPLGRLLRARIERLNATLRRVAEATGAVLVDFARDPRSSDRRLWSPDGFHVNALGHEGMASALAEALGLPAHGFDTADLAPLRPESLSMRVARESAWVVRYLVPWLWRSARERSSGDGRRAKRPDLREVVSAADR